MMFDSTAQGTDTTHSVMVSKAENGFIVTASGVQRVYADFETMGADLKMYFQV